jgi:hypothetical protein
MRVAHALADRSDVRFVALVTGSFDIVMELIVPSRRYLAGVLLEELPKVGGIEDTTTETVLRNFKMSYDWSSELLGADGGQLEEPAADLDGRNGGESSVCGRAGASGSPLSSSRTSSATKWSACVGHT